MMVTSSLSAELLLQLSSPESLDMAVVELVAICWGEGEDFSPFPCRGGSARCSTAATSGHTASGSAGIDLRLGSGCGGSGHGGSSSRRG